MSNSYFLTASKTLALVSLTALACTASLAGGLSPDPRSMTVNLAGLDSNSPADAREIYTRLRAAANSVCGLSFQADPFLGAKFDRCQKATLKQAVGALNKPLVTKIYNQRNHDLSDVGSSPSLAAVVAK
jgi:UrcA family protein